MKTLTFIAALFWILGYQVDAQTFKQLLVAPGGQSAELTIEQTDVNFRSIEVAIKARWVDENLKTVKDENSVVLLTQDMLEMSDNRLECLNFAATDNDFISFNDKILLRFKLSNNFERGEFSIKPHWQFAETYHEAMSKLTRKNFILKQPRDLVLNYQVDKIEAYRPVKQELPPDLYAELDFVDENSNGILEALETAELVVNLSNKGKGKAQNIKVYLLDNLNDHAIVHEKILINYLDPNDSETVRIPIKAGKGTKTALHQFEIKVEEHFGYDMDKAQMNLNSLAYQQPKIAVVGLEITDRGENTMARIQDDKIQSGEKVKITMVLQNIGHGLARNVNFKVASDDMNIYLNDNMGSLGDLNPGEYKKVNFYLSPNKRVETSDNLPVYLSVADEINPNLINNEQLPLFLNKQAQETKIHNVTADVGSLQQNISLFESNSSKFKAKFGEIHKIREITPSRTKRDNSVAVIIGVEQYKELPPAPYAANDAALMERYFKDVLGIDQVITFTNDQVSGFFFDDVFNPETGELQRAIIKGETDLFVFYSGHGVPDKTGKNIYLFPYDGKISRIEQQGYNINDLYTNLDKLGAASVTVFIDACFSGTSKASDKHNLENLVGAKGMVIKPQFEKPWEKNPDFVVFNSSSGSETSLGFDNSQTGLFTYYLAAGLQGQADQNTDKQVTMQELSEYVIKNVVETSKKIIGLQTPEFNGKSNKVLVEY